MTFESCIDFNPTFLVCAVSWMSIDLSEREGEGERGERGGGGDIKTMCYIWDD